MIRGKGALSLNSIADVWKNVLDRLRSQLSETTINTWFDEVEVVTMEDSAFVLHCSNSFKKSTIEARFMSHIKAALKDIFSSDLEVKNSGRSAAFRLSRGGSRTGPAPC